VRDAIRKVISLEFARSGRTSGPDCAENSAPEINGTVLLVTRDKLSEQWAPRWLQQIGLEVTTVGSTDEALSVIERQMPTIVVSDARLSDGNGQAVLAILRKALGSTTPLIALCGGNTDVALATEADVTDIARRPYEWELISRRVIAAVRASDALSRLRVANARLAEMKTSISEERQARTKHAGVDPVTQLPGLEKFRNLLHKVTAGKASGNNDLCLLVIGIDRFRLVNEAVGYQNANVLLRQFADRLRDCLRDRRVIGDAGSGSLTAISGRLGGARFGMLVTHGANKQIKRVCKAITQRLAEPFVVAGQGIYLTASIGAAVFPRDCSSADDLLRCAENAMFDAQTLGSGFQLHNEMLDTGSFQSLAMDRMLREALQNDEFTLNFQPIVDTETGKTVAAEALLRWQQPKHGFISPADFVPIAESTGLMTEIGDWVIKTACRQLADWLEQGAAPVRMAVNLSLCQLLRGDIVSTVRAALVENRIAPDLLELELSERGVLNQSPAVIEVVRELKELGVRISIDDFGTGQAAIGYLKDLPIDVIKIDRSYISGEDRTTRDAAIASGMVALANRLDANVIAEGIETKKQLKLARKWGVTECQGFLFDAALSGEDFAARIVK
jgi:diguanylate cyclase (GGDEF)-like protein